MKKTTYVNSPATVERAASDVELAWVAGFFDGEGYTGARKTKYGTYQLQLQIQQKGREPLDRVCEILGGKVYTLKSRPGIFKWSLHKKQAVKNALGLLWPYLTKVKKEQANKALRKDLGYEEI